MELHVDGELGLLGSHQPFYYGGATHYGLYRLDQLKAEILGAAWVAANRIASNWHDLVKSFGATLGDRAEQQWLTAVSRYRRQLGCWRVAGYFPVGVIVVPPLSGDSVIESVYFVVC